MGNLFFRPDVLCQRKFEKPVFYCDKRKQIAVGHKKFRIRIQQVKNEMPEHKTVIRQRVAIFGKLNASLPSLQRSDAFDELDFQRRYGLFRPYGFFLYA